MKQKLFHHLIDQVDCRFLISHISSMSEHKDAPVFERVNCVQVFPVLGLNLLKSI